MRSVDVLLLLIMIAIPLASIYALSSILSKLIEVKVIKVFITILIITLGIIVSTMTTIPY